MTAYYCGFLYDDAQRVTHARHGVTSWEPVTPEIAAQFVPPEHRGGRWVAFEVEGIYYGTPRVRFWGEWRSSVLTNADAPRQLELVPA